MCCPSDQTIPGICFPLGLEKTQIIKKEPVGGLVVWWFDAVVEQLIEFLVNQVTSACLVCAITYCLSNELSKRHVTTLVSYWKAYLRDEYTWLSIACPFTVGCVVLCSDGWRLTVDGWRTMTLGGALFARLVDNVYKVLGHSSRAERSRAKQTDCFISLSPRSGVFFFYLFSSFFPLVRLSKSQEKNGRIRWRSTTRTTNE